jgi:hypothetical protein
MVAMCSKGTEISLESVSSASLSYEGDSRPAATSMAAATIFVGSGGLVVVAERGRGLR